MAKLYGLSGKAHGRKGDSVFSVVGGQQLVSQYNPIRVDVKSERQLQQRAKMKLISQLAMILAQVIAIKKAGPRSARAQFISENYKLLTFANNTASIDLNKVQLTKAFGEAPAFTIDRDSENEETIVQCKNNMTGFDSVVYVPARILNDGSIRLLDPVAVVPNAGNPYAVDFIPFVEGSVIVWAYAVKSVSSATSEALSNVSGNPATHIASLVSSRSASFSGIDTTKTSAASLAVGENHADSENEGKYHVSVSITGSGSVSGTGYFVPGERCNLVATASAGSSFVGWYSNGTLVTSNASFSFIVDGDVVLEARFQSSGVVIAATVDPAGVGTIIGNGTYPAGTEVRLYCDHDVSYYITWWEVDGDNYGDDDECYVEAQEGITIVCHLSNE